jgi:hypothetical protein
MKGTDGTWTTVLNSQSRAGRAPDTVRAVFKRGEAGVPTYEVAMGEISCKLTTTAAPNGQVLVLTLAPGRGVEDTYTLATLAEGPLENISFARIPYVQRAAAGPVHLAGECVRANDGYTWYIADDRGGKYVSMGWQGPEKGWGNPTNFDYSTLRSHIPVECPRYGK